MCTCARLRAEDGSIAVGRTMEFAATLASHVCVLPRGFEGRSSAPTGAGCHWTAELGVVGISAFGNAQTLTDGMNEKGLYAGDLYMPHFCDYSPADGHAPDRLLAPADMVAFVLGQCSSVDQARAAMADVVVWPSVVESMGFAPPLHLVLHDAGGDSAVIEWRDGEMLVFDNPIGVVTNAPHLDWHYVNLRNFVMLSSTNPRPGEVEGVVLHPLGQGVGLSGLPGDSSPPSRFVRATAFVATHEPVAGSAEVTSAMWHLMNNFDIPRGSVRSSDGTSVEHTRWTTVVDLADRHYIVRSHDDHTPRLVDLNDVDLDGDVRQVPLPREPWARLAV